MLKEEFINKVLTVINEHDVELSEFIGSDTALIRAHIESLFPAVWVAAVKRFPHHLFHTTDFSSRAVTADLPQGRGYITLPADWLTLAEYKMQGWENSCYEAQAPDSPTALKQRNKYVCGSPQRPVCVIENKGNASILSYYSLPKHYTKHNVEKATYIKSLTAIPAVIPVYDGVISALVYLLASATMKTLNKDEISKTLDKEVDSFVSGN